MRNIPKDQLKLTNDTKALIKDLEMQIDYLVGYSPQGNHWKLEFHVRDEFINAVLSEESTPPEICDKVARIQDKIYRLKNHEILDQPYFTDEALLEEQQRMKLDNIVFIGSAKWRESFINA